LCRMGRPRHPNKIVFINQADSLPIWVFKILPDGPATWFMAVILASWEAEIRRIMFWGQPWQIVLETLPQPVTGCGGMCQSSRSSPAWAKKQDPISKKN
jgi:hypothetical protein